MVERASRDAFDPAGLSERLGALVGRMGRIAARWLERATREDEAFAVPAPEVVAETLEALARALLSDPDRFAAAILDWHGRLFALLGRQLARRIDPDLPAFYEPEPADRRFADPDWSEDPRFDTLKQVYLMTCAWLRELVATAPGLDAKTRARAAFYVRLALEALSPANHPATNPVVLREALASRGETLLRGLERLVLDLERGGGRLPPAPGRTDAFVLGRDIATTPGAVIFETELAQLIQYAPTTETVFARPLLIVPPWINKYYILDLRPRNSLVRYLVDNGFTVFVLSWVNPGEDLAHKTFEDYLREGPLAAIEAIARATGERRLNLVGYCLGGTLAACLLAHLWARGEERRVASATFLTTMLDFAEPGELGVFIDERQLELLERHMARKGYLEARWMQQVFSLMRANDLVWSFFVQQYLLGREPPPFDLLHWNADGTRMPYMMHKFYLRQCYLENRLVEPGAITLLGTPIDLGRIATPAYFLSTREDHIAPWRSTYAGARRLSGPVRFVLAGSGHIAGVVNPPEARKYGYWTRAVLPPDPEAWLARARFRPGSWWPHWRAWLARFGGRKVPARPPGAGPLPAIEPAPGRYVRMRADD
ncbi:MAG: class I poly(R)-hydroxyalkanoic acid synthase [Geminicoccaceae bacterium]|nr:class I poly(R)-hydroxyalkanoic acid synthase [Geminicoccaceae bacterium]MDW8123685.1 class I poly(R)-hydroxyalkanoic acid synthase [Geminicoccaceae bacterium]